jgi:hypothetical protein
MSTEGGGTATTETGMSTEGGDAVTTETGRMTAGAQIEAAGEMTRAWSPIAATAAKTTVTAALTGPPLRSPQSQQLRCAIITSLRCFPPVCGLTHFTRLSPAPLLPAVVSLCHACPRQKKCSSQRNVDFWYHSSRPNCGLP